jgi:hypothetical protein
LAPIYVLSRELEAVRDLVRARENAPLDRMREDVYRAEVPRGDLRAVAAGQRL